MLRAEKKRYNIVISESWNVKYFFEKWILTVWLPVITKDDVDYDYMIINP